MDLITNILVIGSWAGALWFVVRYARVAWRASSAGKNAMAFMAVIATVLTLAVVSIFWPEADWRPYARLGSWVAIFVVIWHRVWVFEGGQAAGRRRVRDNPSAAEHTDQR